MEFQTLLLLTLVVCCQAAPRAPTDDPATPPTWDPNPHRYVRLDLGKNYDSLTLEVPELKHADPPVVILWEKAGMLNKTIFEPIYNGTEVLTYAYYVTILTHYSVEMYTQPIWTEGWWRASWVNPTTEAINTITWEVRTHQAPVLVPRAIMMQNKRPSLSLMCQSLDHPHNRFLAYMEIQSYSKTLTWNVHARVDGKPSEATFSVTPHLLCPVKFEVRCCLPTPSQPVCNYWRKIWLGDHVPRKEVAEHRACPTTHEGAAFPTHSSHHGYTNGQCDDTAITDAISVSPYMLHYPYCPGSLANITHPYGTSNVWYYHNGRFGQEWPLYETERGRIVGPYNRTILLEKVASSDTGVYTTHVSSNNEPENFVEVNYFLTVEPFLRASIELYQFDPASITLKCVSSLNYRYQEVHYTWEVSHMTDSYSNWGNYLYIRPDCWAGNKLKSSFAVRCHVSTKIWFTSSQWFIAEFERSPSKYTSPTCARKSHLPFEPPITEKPHSIKTEL